MVTGDTGTQTDVTRVEIAYPRAEALSLRIAVGACRLRIRAGDSSMWVTGTYHDPNRALPLDIIQDGASVLIAQRRDLPDMTRLVSGTPTLELELGRSLPYSLTIETGASESVLELGAVPLTALTIKGGAGKLDVNFSRPNPQDMTSLTVASGASGIEMKNLLNAAFAELRVEGGAVSYKLDFGGVPRRSSSAKITTAVSGIEVHIPSATPARITSTAVMGAVTADAGFTRHDGAYLTRSVTGSVEPLLKIDATVTMGALNLHSS